MSRRGKDGWDSGNNVEMDAGKQRQGKQKRERGRRGSSRTARLIYVVQGRGQEGKLHHRAIFSICALGSACPPPALSCSGPPPLEGILNRRQEQPYNCHYIESKGRTDIGMDTRVAPWVSKHKKEQRQRPVCLLFSNFIDRENGIGGTVVAPPCLDTAILFFFCVKKKNPTHTALVPQNLFFHSMLTCAFLRLLSPLNTYYLAFVPD